MRMGKRVLLCADEESLRSPRLLGLEEECLSRISWLQCCSSAEACRRAAARPSVEEIWIVSCGDMEPINVAAAVKADNPFKKVYLAGGANNGSFASRVASASIDGIVSSEAFVERFCQAQQLWRDSRDDSGDASPGQSSEDFPNRPAEGNAGGKRALPLGDSRALRDGAGAVISVVGASGGCGKGSVASVFATLCARAGLRTLAIDADLQFGDMHRMLGIKEPIRIDDVIRDPSRMSRLYEDAKATGKPSLLAAPLKLESSEAIAAELVDIIEAARGDYDAVVVCAGSFWDEIQAQIVEAADAVAFLVDSRPSSLAATVHAVELCARMGLATGGFTYVVNKHSKESLLSAVDVSCTLKGAACVELSDGGRDVEELLGAGFPDEFVSSKNPLLGDALALLSRLLPPDQAQKLEELELLTAKRRRLFGRRQR